MSKHSNDKHDINYRDGFKSLIYFIESESESEIVSEIVSESESEIVSEIVSENEIVSESEIE